MRFFTRFIISHVFSKNYLLFIILFKCTGDYIGTFLKLFKNIRKLLSYLVSLLLGACPVFFFPAKGVHALIFCVLCCSVSQPSILFSYKAQVDDMVEDDNVSLPHQQSFSSLKTDSDYIYQVSAEIDFSNETGLVFPPTVAGLF